jgi:hypothetical protein
MADDGWQADWETSRRAQLESQLDATPAQRLAWLEDALRLAFAAGALPRAPAPEDGADGSPDRADGASSESAS